MQLILHPLGLSKRQRFGLPTGEGVPSRIEGWGVRLMGSREEFPFCGSDKVRGFLPCKAWFGEANEPRRARPNEIWYNVLDQIIDSLNLRAMLITKRGAYLWLM
jgi:hypothetical protein